MTKSYYAYYRLYDGSDGRFECESADEDYQIWCCPTWNSPTKQEVEADDWEANEDQCGGSHYMCYKSEFNSAQPETGGEFVWTNEECTAETFTISDKSSVNDDVDDDGESAIAFNTTDLDSLIIGVAAGILLMVIIMVCCILSKRRRKRLDEENGVEMSTTELNKMDTKDFHTTSIRAANDTDVFAEDGGQAGTETVVNV